MSDWSKFYEVYFPMKKFYGLRLTSHESSKECCIKITQGGKEIIKCEGEESDVVIANATRELEYWEHIRKRASVSQI